MHNFSYLRVMSMGGHFFLQTWICMAMIFEPYLGCYGSILSPDLVCCSWDYGLSIKWSSILNRMSGTCSNFQFILLKHITLICQHDKLPKVSTRGLTMTTLLLLLLLLLPRSEAVLISSASVSVSVCLFVC